ncbi:MAG TPA: PhoX family phosphatase, partial [Ilumatobacteraceae bacterium]|nr:PhoX family phosphatase [Ilumatobacteraceae bacterium]
FGSSALAERVEAAGRPPGGPGMRPGGSLIGFTEVPVSDADDIEVPPGYIAQLLIPWGPPLVGGSEWKADASNTSAEQALQVGFNHDGMHYFPLQPGARGNGSGLLVLNHEYTDASQIYTADQGSAITNDAAGMEKVAKALAAHGVTVVEVQQLSDGSWTHVVGSRFNRRITGTTPMNFSGPVGADHPMLESNNPPIGTLNNCAHGYTPWGTYLACEENWNGYFGTNDTTWTPTALEARYGVNRSGFGYNWFTADKRFDLAVNRNELNRFGWVVEIDPFDPGSTPVKRTALGRIKHEGATFTEARGRAVLYTGDDENGDYLYKYVSARPWRQARAQRRSPLDEGTLYVAVFDGAGNGTWQPLVHGTGPLTVSNGWVDQADVLIRTRVAADAVGATRLHRPEWVTVNERNKDVFLTLTNGTINSSAPVNSNRDPNPYGHIVRIRENQRDNTATSFTWDIYVIAGDPNYDTTVPTDQPLFGSPDGIWADPDGRLWIQTDISNSSQNRSDRGYDNIKNNQMLVGDPDTGEMRRFLTGPRGCEITGVITTPDQRTMFVNVQHPGESTTYWNNLNGTPSTTAPATVSSWPHLPGDVRPRPATIVIRKLDGGKIGT